MKRRQWVQFAPALAAATAFPVLVSPARSQSANTIRLGCTAPLTGPLAAFGIGVQHGTKAAMMEINAKGGVQGRELQFELMDDAYTAPNSVENVKKLLADKSIFGLISCVGTPNNLAFMPLVTESNIPYVGPLTGASSLRKSTDRSVFHVRASYTDETVRLVQKLVEMQITNLAIVYLDNAFGKEVLADAKKAMAAQNIKPAAELALAADGANLKQVVDQLLAAKPSALLIGTAGAASASLISAVRSVNPALPMAGLSVMLASEQLQKLGEAARGTALTMVLPNPTSSKFAITRRYQAAIRAAGHDGFMGGFESYVNTLVFAEGLERSGRDLTRPKFIAAMSTMRSFDMGGLNLGFSGSPFVASKFIDLGIVGSGGKLSS
jgi:branched-chain amino acid transport system substrate-binding protein